MVYIKNKTDCCGCTACYAACQQNAIYMEQDDEGFLYPHVDLSSCIQCGVCEKICRFKMREPKSNSKSEAYIAVHRSLEVLKNSTSGGVFTALSDFILNKNGVVYGAVYDDLLCVKHIRAETDEERNNMRGSKYVQSDMNDCYRSVQKDLQKNKWVLFTGTPCQVDGLYAFFAHKSYDNLVTCDVICYGTSSPLVLNEHIRMLEKKYHTKFSNYECRPAKNGHEWGCATELAVAEDGREIHSNPWIGLKRRLFYANVDKRPACHNCKYCNYDRPGDITIGDCQMARRLIPECDFSYGASTVLINSQKAKDILTELRKKMVLWRTTTYDISQYPLRECAAPSKRREIFWRTLKKQGYIAAVKACFGNLVIVKDWIRLNTIEKIR